MDNGKEAESLSAVMPAGTDPSWACPDRCSPEETHVLLVSRPSVRLVRGPAPLSEELRRNERRERVRKERGTRRKKSAWG